MIKDVEKEGKTREQIKADRMKAFKRPKLIKDRQALRKERIDAVRGYDSDLSI